MWQALHPAQVNLYMTRKQNTLNMLWILNEEKVSLISNWRKNTFCLVLLQFAIG